MYIAVFMSNAMKMG